MASRASASAADRSAFPAIVSLPDGKDPADLVMEGGAEAVAEVLRTGMGYIPFLRDLADRRGDDREVRERALRQALGTIAGISDPLRQEYVLQEAGEVFGGEGDGQLRIRPERRLALGNRVEAVPEHRASGRRHLAALPVAPPLLVLL